MRTIWHSLAWKEWHEHKWKLAALMAIVVGTSAPLSLGIGAESLTFMPLMAMFCLAPLTIFVATRDATGEKAQRTMALLQALPIPRWQIAFQKLLFGLLTCITPMVCTVALVLVWQRITVPPAALSELHPPWWPNDPELGLVWWYLAVFSITVVVVVSLYLWTAAVAVVRNDEVSGGAAALAIIAILWGIFLTWATYLDEPPDVVISALPGGFATSLSRLFDAPGTISWTKPLISAGIVHSALAIWFIARFGNEIPNGITSKRVAKSTGKSFWLGPPRRSRFSAIVWKQLREMAPIMLAGLAAAVCFFVATWIGVGGIDLNNTNQLLEVTLGVIAYVGFVVTLVVGIGLFLNDLSPRLNAFWRSRPISPGRWYWLKFCTGLFVLSAAFLLPTSLGGQLNHPELLLGIAIYGCLYTAAVAMTCLVRHAIYSAVLAMALVGFSMIITALMRRGLMYLGVLEDVPEYFRVTEGEIVFAMIVTTVLCTIIGWLAVRNDWGWKAGRG